MQYKWHIAPQEKVKNCFKIFPWMTKAKGESGRHNAGFVVDCEDAGESNEDATIVLALASRTVRNGCDNRKKQRANSRH